MSTLHLAYHKFLAWLSSDKQPSKLVVRMYPLSFLQLTCGGYEMVTRRIWQTALWGRWRRKLGIVTQTIINDRGTILEQVQTEQNRNYRDRKYDSCLSHNGLSEWLEDCSRGGLLELLSGQVKFGKPVQSTALCTAPSTAPLTLTNFQPILTCGTSAFLLPIMESIGVKYCPEVSSGVVVWDLVVDLTEVAPYWNFIFHRVRPSQLSHLVDFGVLPRPAFYFAGFCWLASLSQKHVLFNTWCLASLVPEKLWGGSRVLL